MIVAALYFGLRGLGFYLIKLGQEQERQKQLKAHMDALLEVYLCPSCLKYSAIGRPCESCGRAQPREPSVAVMTRRQAQEHNS